MPPGENPTDRPDEVDPPVRRIDATGALRGFPGAATALVATVTAGSALAAVVAPPAAGPAGDAQPCSAEVSPDTITIRHRPVRVLARIPGELGEVEGVDAPEASGLEVLDVEADRSGDAWIVRLGLSDARAGRWTLDLRGSEGTCQGTLTTRMPGRALALARTDRSAAHATDGRRRR